jgi:molybdopterin-binding protein
MMPAIGRLTAAPFLLCSVAASACELARQKGNVMKLSARNVMPGKVVAIIEGATTAHVKIEVATGFVVTASITNEAVDALGLAVGRQATAIVKSSDVIVGVD